MISNYVLRDNRVQLKKQRVVLAEKRRSLQETLKNLGLTATQKHNKSSTIPHEVWDVRDKILNELSEVEEQAAALNNKRLEYHTIEDSEKNKQLLNIFKEIFTIDQIIEIRKEAERRMEGEHPFRLSFNVQNCIKVTEERDKYKKELISQLDVVIGFRNKLTQLIDKGCEQFGKMEFLTFISPLNRQIIPIQELEKIKRKIIG